ncbi:hypothetical protein NC651_028992 [Populus alba x Populus x berolinensis]|nr:hypothetical protein NC651_028992 [Populus alba x Populus x berolinensis]
MTPPYVPKQFDRCAVIGNSGDFLKTKFGKEIDDYDVVIRENGVPVEEVPINNPVYLMLGASFGSAAKGTGLEALEFALSICDSVDMHGFTVKPGYKEWTRYSSESRQGHTPLHYQTLPSFSGIEKWWKWGLLAVFAREEKRGMVGEEDERRWGSCCEQELGR